MNTDDCERCDGYGTIERATVCGRCHGERVSTDADGVPISCPDCEGSGEGEPLIVPCPTCGESP